MNAYAPRRQSHRWLDGDCPRGVLAIYKHPDESDPYTIFYYPEDIKGRANTWVFYLASDEHAQHYHGEMEAYKVAEYRYRNKHRACKWTDVPKAVRDYVIYDLEHPNG